MIKTYAWCGMKIKYDYIYGLAHKVLAEAKAIKTKRKFDPDQNIQNYLQKWSQKLHNDADFVLISD